MKVKTWSPDTDLVMDQLFDQLREKQYNDKTHRLWKNYSKENFKHAVALTIVFNKDDVPEVCTSISSRSCWPENVYRIYNRTWKPFNKQKFLRTVTPAMGLAGQDQIAWLKNKKCDLYFISRETENWQSWMIENFAKDFNINFKSDNYMYLTCPNECDESCWQRIIYNGDENVLKKWKRRN
jgi:hypothetical protein